MYYFFGAGQNCVGALEFFGKDKVKAIIDNSPARQGTDYFGVPVISFDEFLKRNAKETVIITTILCSEEIAEQLRKNSIYDFFICPYMQAGFYKCEEIIKNFSLLQYNSFAIYDKNPVSEFLMEEIEKRKGCACDIYYVDDEEWESDRTINADVFLIIKEMDEDNNSRKLECENIINLYSAIKERKHEEYNYLRKYQNCHLGQTCFLIGNGPSLKAEDLDMIKQAGILSFGCNRIYRIFDNTDWRPDYYVIIDHLMNDPILKSMEETVFFVRDFLEAIEKRPNINLFNCVIERYYPEYPKFSDDLVQGTYSGTTVLYAMLQIAVYMGIKKIYLLGVDFSWGEDGRDTHFCKDYMDDQIVKDMMIHKEEQRHAYISAKKYAEEHDIEIMNATRGGHLNVFERIEFDKIFQ